MEAWAEGFPDGSDGKESAYTVGHLGLIPGLGRSPGEGNSYPLIPDHLTCLLRNLYAGQEATVRTGHGTTDCFQIGKGVRQGCIVSLCLYNLYAEYIMINARMDEAQAGIKIARRNINNLRRSPGEGKGHSVQYSCLENSMDRGAWQATVCGVPKSQT